MHVVGDFLKRRIVPLQARARLSCWFTGSNDLGRVHHGPGTDLSWEELELLVKGITGESFAHETLIPPEGIPSLCEDQGLRVAILDWLSTLDKSGVAVHQTGGRDPHREIQISGVPAGGFRPADAGSRAPPVALSPLDKGKGAASSSSAPGGSGRSEGESGTDWVAPTGLPSRIRPLIRTSPRSARGQLAGPRRPAPRPRARRGASVIHQHHHQTRHRRRHHHLARHCPRGSSTNNNSSRGNRRLTSRVAGRFRAPSMCTPFYFPH
jgi:hypothetical protein